MNSKSQIGLFLVLISLATLAIGIIPKAVAGPPETGNLLCKIFFDPTTESWSLDTGDIDMNDWPLTKDFITRWAERPDITMDEYAEIGKMEFDINNQWWPTGPEDPTHTTAAPRNVFYDGTQVRHQAALHFRRAIAHLTDKGAYVTQQGGQAYPMETEVPVPALGGYTDYGSLENDTAIGKLSLTAPASAGATRIYVESTKCFKASNWIVIGEVATSREEKKHIFAVGTNYFDLSLPLQKDHPAGEPVRRYILTGVSGSWGTKLTAGASSGATRIFVASTAGFVAGQWIRIGEVTQDTAEGAYIVAVGAGFFDVYDAETKKGNPLQKAHSINERVRAETPDPGYYYRFSNDLAIGEFMEGGFEDWDGDTYIEWSGNGGTTYEELPNMKIWIRIDDPNRRFAGEHLYNELLSKGIPPAPSKDAPGLWKEVTERSACFNAVMVLYNYNIYTGGWSLSADVDFIHDLYHSSMGQYAWAQNYAGFKNTEFDYWAEKVKYPPTAADVKPAAINAQWVKAKYMPVVELWAAKAVKAYRTGWDGVVNFAGAGIDNFWSYHNMKWVDGEGTSRNGPDNTIVQGFKSDISALHVVSSEWLWDWNALAKIYDSLLARNPYDLTEETGWMASKWGTSLQDWNLDGKMETVAEYELRTDLYFHDGSAVTPLDVVESLLLPKAAGAGVAWNYPTVMDIDHIQVSGQTIRVFFSVQSYWALHWAGFMPIFLADLWKTGINAMGAGYSGVSGPDAQGNYYPGTFTNAMAVRDYRPWEMNYYKPADGKVDLSEDGSFMYVFDAYVTGQSITYHAFSLFYNEIWDHSKGNWVKYPDGTYTWVPPCTFYKLPISYKKDLFFHRTGNVNSLHSWGVQHTWYTSDRIIDANDRYRVTRAVPTTDDDPTKWGSGDLKFNPDCDFNGDKAVNIIDKVIVNLNYLRTAG